MDDEDRWQAPGDKAELWAMNRMKMAPGRFLNPGEGVDLKHDFPDIPCKFISGSAQYIC